MSTSAAAQSSHLASGIRGVQFVKDACRLASQCLSARQNTCLFQTDTLGEGIGMAVRLPPFFVLAAINQGDAQRPVLHRQTADLHPASFDNGEDNHVG